MELLSTAKLRRVICHQGGPCISLYHSLAKGNEVAHRSRLVERAAVQLLETYSTQGNRRSAPIVASLDRLALHASEHCNAESVAVFCAPRFEACFALPIGVPESVRIADRFDVRPILKLWRDPTRFYLLVVNDRQARMGLATAKSLALSPLPWQETGAGGTPSRLTQLDRRMARLLKPETAPVIIAATESARPHLVQLHRLERTAHLPHDVTELPSIQLHRRALRAAKPLLTLSPTLRDLEPNS
jgi:hypothetical protein